MKLEIKKAVRRALPIQSAFFAPTGAGKTFSALRFAAGLSKTGKVCMINTERGRGALYGDNKKILAELPQGYSIVEIDNPFHPKVCIEALDLVEAAGFDVCLIDNGSDFWDGPGGCTDIAENAKNMWNGAKLWNKRMMTRVANSDMNVIWCFKAQDKTKIVDAKKSASGKQEYLDMGMQPITEKNNLFPQLLVFFVDPITHLSTVTKCTDDLWGLFPKPKLISKEDGEAVRKWNEGGAPAEDGEQLLKRARSAADLGSGEYKAFFERLSAAQRKALAASGAHEENKALAFDADNATKSQPPDDPAPVIEKAVQDPPTSGTIRAIENFEATLGSATFVDELKWLNFAGVGDIKTELEAKGVLEALQRVATKGKP